MRNPEKDAAEQAKRRQGFSEHGFALFSSKNIEAIRLQGVAKASGYGIATLYRYFTTKAGFAVAIAEWKWNGFFDENRRRRPTPDFAGMTAADMFDFYLDSFLALYRNNKDLLRFNHLLNIYIHSGEFDAATVERYRGLMQPVGAYFHAMYQKALGDHTLRTDEPEEKMLSTTIHLMLAAVTRYAVGLVYQPEGGFDDIQELKMLKDLLMMKYTAP